MQVDNRHEAIRDCKYILTLSETALNVYLEAWCDDSNFKTMTEDDKEYSLTIKEIAGKLHTNECLLKEDRDV